ncbi:Lon protease-like protein [Roseimicrobium gellanilyticum]|uniref:Lon protease-like protein n=1 Tax=Roseimicrobium gellanilyticum TaxID=748857 RepID=A0A366H4Q6_9BACT|nr:S16 family serine protease [Roseimicrobium gellanilyticum]RBP36599.1 Lon protease-like protein [Roseimicrobium gellanilyticum]
MGRAIDNLSFFLMDGRVKCRAIFWKILGPVVCGLVAVSPLEAQSTSSCLFYNSSQNIQAARYDSPEPFWIHGGDVQAGEPGAFQAQRIDITIAEDTEFHGVALTFSNANVRAKKVLFKGGTIEVANGARLMFEDCIFDGVTFSVGEPLPTQVTNEAPEVVFEKYRGHLSMKNSVLHKVLFQVKGGASALVGLKMEQCTVHGPDSLLPVMDVKAGFLEEAKRNQTEVVGCAFHQCSFSPAFLAVTRGSAFDNCSLISGLPMDGLPTGVQVSATFTPTESAQQITAQLPQFVITPLSPAVVTGAGLGYSIAGGEVTRNSLPPTLASVRLAAMLPPAARRGPVPVMASVPATPPGANPVSMPSREPVPMYEPAPVSSSPSVPPMVTGTPGLGLKSKQTSVHGLLIMSLAAGEAGAASKMAAIALQNGGTSPAVVQFNQPVGEMMDKALAEVIKFTQLNNNGWPEGYQIELSFADKYSNKDGPSAAVACALLLHSLFTGKELDPTFAVTGDMNADGTVQPIGGVAAKIRGATKGHCKLVGIPVKNEASLRDVLLMDGPAPFASIQIFSITKFGEAEALALAQKPAATQAAISEMNRVQEVLMRNPGQMGLWLRNQHVIAKLQQVLKDAPNHLSAKYLLMHASGKAPLTLSLAGSLTTIDDNAGELLAAIKSNRGEAFDSMGKSSVGSSLTRLQSVRAKCDVRARPYADAIIDFGTAVKEAQDRPAQTGTRATEYRNKIRGAAASVEAAMNRLMNDPTVREELDQ